MNRWTILLRACRWATAGLFAVAFTMPASAQQSAYRYTLPTGWTRSIDGGVETLTPTAESAGTVQALLLPPKPLAQDFDAQFDAERSALEAHWGLTVPLPVPPQRALGRQGKFSMLVFVAASDDAFNRLAPQATQFWQGLQLLP